MSNPPFEWIAIASFVASSREICRWLIKTVTTSSMGVVLSFKTSMPVVKPAGVKPSRRASRVSGGKVAEVSG